MTGEKEPEGTAVICLSCAIFRDVLPRLTHPFPGPINLRFFNSMLHMDPDRMKAELFPAIRREGATRKVVVWYGDCHPDPAYQEKRIADSIAARGRE